MTWWEIALPSATYGIGWLICARLLAGHWAWAEAVRRSEMYRSNHYPAEPYDFGWYLLGGLVIGWTWPLVLAAKIVRLDRFAIGAEREAIIHWQQERIAELEREAGFR